MTAQLIPTSPQAQTFSITLGTVNYNILLQWNVQANCWMMDLLDSDNNELLSGIPLLPGEDLIGQFEYLLIGGGLDAGEIQVQTTNDTFAVPTYANLGSEGNLYWVTP